MKKSLKYLGTSALLMAIMFANVSQVAAAGFKDKEHGPFKDLTDEQRLELKDLRDAGDMEALKTKMEEYGIEFAPMNPDKMPGFDKEKTEAVKAALEANDYKAFVDVVGEELAAKVDEDTFAILVEAHTLRESGDYEAARTKMEELKGILPPFGGPHSHIEDLTDEDKEVLDQAKELRDQGEKEKAKELMQNYFGDRLQKPGNDEDGQRGFFGKIKQGLKSIF